ncbi:hypothetical protein COLO4_15305 [Corchorus olitorius]|uniref:Uncharacterized protein n=1 Tax=Corchorus olitorius TaxID=93759 RepID=A0A1R3JNJ6_9ROSI|nr:hypothetical protein COLO4_15305 [Corchorus olitorius]
MAASTFDEIYERIFTSNVMMNVLLEWTDSAICRVTSSN